MTEENEEVRDAAALLAAYNKLKVEIKELATERDGLKSNLDALKEQIETDEFRIKALTAEAKLALTEQGIKDERALKLVGTEGLDFAEDGSITGLKERVKELSTEWPEIFDAKRRAGGKADIFANDDANIEGNPLRSAVHAALNK